MNSRDKQALRKKKNLDRMRWIIASLLAIGLIASGHYVYGLLLLLFFYLLHEALWSDHIFYNPKQDYLYQLDAEQVVFVDWNKKQSLLTVEPITAKADSFFLLIDVKAGLLGKVFDPYVEISYAGNTIKQYFERSLNGRRYINISDLKLNEVKNQVIQMKLKPAYCRIKGGCTELLAFNNPNIQNKKILVIAPHADDAELAAFALYSEQQSMVVTLTAGETEEKDFQQVYQDRQQASLLKGRLRSLDSVTAGVWAGLDQANIISLGYFCQCLQKMHDQPGLAVGSRTAGVNDVRIFREFNKNRLKTDQDGKPSWQNLISDLQEVISGFQPDVIVTPHPQLDPHSDHIYGTKAVLQSLSNQSHSVTDLLFYANHYHNTDIFPFGLPHTTVSVAPSFDPLIKVSLLSYPVTEDKQKDKVFAIEVMHDLKGKLKLKKRLRRIIQAKLVGRTINPYGDDDYFRKSIRANELFYRVPVNQALEYFNEQHD